MLLINLSICLRGNIFLHEQIDVQNLFEVFVWYFLCASFGVVFFFSFFAVCYVKSNSKLL